MNDLFRIRAIVTVRNNRHEPDPEPPDRDGQLDRPENQRELEFENSPLREPLIEDDDSDDEDSEDEFENDAEVQELLRQAMHGENEHQFEYQPRQPDEHHFENQPEIENEVQNQPDDLPVNPYPEFSSLIKKGKKL